MWLIRLHAEIQSWVDQPYLAALFIGVLSLVVARIGDWILCNLVRGLTRRTRTDIDDQLVEMLHRPVFVTIVLVGLALATRQLGLDTGVEPGDHGPQDITFAILATIAIFVWTAFAIRFSRLVLTVLSRYQDRFDLVQPRTLPVFANLAIVGIIGGSVYCLFIAWNVNVTAWVASAGIIGLALSFAAKDSLANLFAGVFILADAPYKVGDYIVLDTGERGQVTQIGIRSTRLLTRDDIEITIPNAVMGNAKIINETGGPHEMERIRVPVGVAYGSDVDRVCELLEQIALSHEEICVDPAPRVRFRSFGDSGLNFELLGWIAEPELRGRLIHELNMDVYKVFQQEGIEIPYPKRDVYVRELPREA